MPRVFVCYRREDSAASAGRVFDRLIARFGRGNVFMDVDTIRPGQDFAARIEGFVAGCDSLVAIVGRDWLRSDGAGTRRIDDPEDYVRLEIHAALTRDTQVIPVLVAGAPMPTAEELPPEIAAFSGRQAIEVSESRFDFDSGRLIEAIEEADTETPRGLFSRLVGWFRAHPKPGIALGAAVAVGAAIATLAATGVFSPGSASSPTVTTVVTRRTPAERELLTHIPSAIRPTCHAPVDPEENNVAAFNCDYRGIVMLQYNLFASHADLQRAVGSVRRRYGDRHECGPRPLLCFVRDGTASIVWTDQPANVLSFAWRDGGKLDALYESWRNEIAS